MTTVETIKEFKHSSDVVKESVSRKRDTLNEKMLQTHYNKLYSHSNLVYERETDKQAQLKGVDVYLYHKGCVAKIDEKTATSCYNRDLRTFSFELMFTKTSGDGKQNVYRGWFANEDQESNAYMLGYVRAPDDNHNFQTIDSLEILLIKKSKLWKYIKSNGYKSAEELMQIFNDAIKNNTADINNYRKTVSLHLNGGMKLIQSLKMQESPVNILIPKDALVKMSSFHSILTYKDGKENYDVIRDFIWKK